MNTTLLLACTVVGDIVWDHKYETTVSGSKYNICLAVLDTEVIACFDGKLLGSNFDLLDGEPCEAVHQVIT